MSDRRKQAHFARCVGELLVFGCAQPGYELTFGDAFRDPRVPYGHPKSCHRRRLAVDLNLFVNGVFIEKSDAPEWQVLGNFWESLDPRARWGGKGKLHPEGLQHDGNHFSFEDEGVE